MAPSGTPWNSWVSSFPGSVEKGPWPCYIIMFGPLVIFLAQAIYAQRLFSKKNRIDKQSISKFYANLIVLNITAMALVTGPGFLNGLVTGFLQGYDGALYPTTPLILWYLKIFAFGVHSVNNCCRIVFDAFGLRAAVWFIPVAASFQLWQVLALPFGFDPYLGVVVLSGIDYLEHLIALMYWLFRLRSPPQQVDDKKRLWCGVWGVLLHKFAIIPAFIYGTKPVHTTGGLCAVYITAIVLMFASQMFWIKMALLTRPSDIDMSSGKERRDMDEDVADDECRA
jgi:hypothetical protein